MALRDAVREAVMEEGEMEMAPDAVPTIALATAQPDFSDLEHRVIDLARGERIGSLEPPGRVERMMAVLFGLRPGGRPLADARLEALRRAVIVARHRRHLPDAHAAELHAVGYTPWQVRAIEARAIAD